MSKKIKYNSGYRFAKTDLKEGTTFDRLVIVGFSHNDKDNRCRHYLCRCDCGKEITTNGRNLREKRTRSCGCFSKENLRNRRKPDDYALKSRVFKTYRLGARSRKLDFNLSRDDLSNIIAMNCHYCNASPANVMRVKDEREMLYNEIDRKDTNKGYSIDNCVPYCRDCNTGKFDKTQKGFIEWICNVYNFYAKKHIDSCNERE